MRAVKWPASGLLKGACPRGPLRLAGRGGVCLGASVRWCVSVYFCVDVDAGHVCVRGFLGLCMFVFEYVRVPLRVSVCVLVCVRVPVYVCFWLRLRVGMSACVRKLQRPVPRASPSGTDSGAEETLQVLKAMDCFSLTDMIMGCSRGKDHT